MYQYRSVAPSDWGWLCQASGLSAWERLPYAQRQRTHPAWAAELLQGALSAALVSPYGVACIAEVGREPVGYIIGAVAPEGDTGLPAGLLLDLWVAPAHRRRGVARALHRIAERAFAAFGARKVKAMAALDNQPALALAGHLAFAAEGITGDTPL